ncbi:hypothetical protein KPH14_013070 [Odynerus spinipes]|uniref:NrS-1 polymerase-like helicase domain-containing protein n=1 Tax=Odynerus spinipes TaxID=1348599 RepID=A0AAD9R839_9HYME|nr:hypothetical protein KPH14_013070 [Odynerus spinipes]
MQRDETMTSIVGGGSSRVDRKRRRARSKDSRSADPRVRQAAAGDAHEPMDIDENDDEIEDAKRRGASSSVLRSGDNFDLESSAGTFRGDDNSRRDRSLRCRGDTRIPLFDSRVSSPLLHGQISRDVKLSVAYALFVIYIFCGCDIAVTLYMLKFLISPIFPGPWSKESTASVFVGTSNSGKSRLVNLLRRFYNSEHGNLNTSILDTSKDNISTAFFPIATNLVCQIDEPRECDAETFKNLISDTPKQARAFHSQQQQAVSNIAKIFITVNQMFQIVSDDGVLTRLQSFFRVTHRHLDTVKPQSDVTKINGEASLNVAHQFVTQNYPKGLHEQTFLRGFFFLVFHWCSSVVTFREEKFTLSDVVCSNYRERVRAMACGALSRDGVDCDSSTCLPTSAATFAEYHPASRNFDRKLDSYFDVHVSASDDETAVRSSDVAVASNCLTRTLFARLSKARDLPSFLGIDRKTIRLRKLYLALHTRINELEVLNFVSLYPRKIRLLEFLSDLLFVHTNERQARIEAGRTSGNSAAVALANADVSFAKIKDDDYDDNHVNLAVKPYKLELLTSEMHNNFDPFVRFQNTHRIVSAEVPIAREKLEYQLRTFLERFNSTIADAKYRVKYNEFYERFVNEYSRFQYVDPKTNKVIPNKWSLRVKTNIN